MATWEDVNEMEEKVNRAIPDDTMFLYEHPDDDKIQAIIDDADRIEALHDRYLKLFRKLKKFNKVSEEDSYKILQCSYTTLWLMYEKAVNETCAYMIAREWYVAYGAMYHHAEEIKRRAGY